MVTRSGGIAGLRRQWRAEPAADDTSAWRTLIDQCPWDAATDRGRAPAPGADRFEWLIHAREDDAEREARLGDHELDGAWRELVDAVRDFGGSRGRRRVSGRSDGSSSPA